MKVCSKCELPKELEEYHDRTIHSPTGKIYYSKYSECKECNKLRCRTYKQRKKDQKHLHSLEALTYAFLVAIFLALSGLPLTRKNYQPTKTELQMLRVRIHALTDTPQQRAAEAQVDSIVERMK